jgi:hypothetical protein
MSYKGSYVNLGTGLSTTNYPSNIAKNLTIEGTLTVDKNLIVKGSSSLSNLNVSGITSLNSNLNVSGITTLSNNLNVLSSYPTILGGTLGVSGITTLNDNLVVSGTKTVAIGGTLGVSGITTLNNNLVVSGTKTSTLGGTLTVSGITTINNNLVVGSAKTTTLGGTLGVSGITTLNDNLVVSGTKTATIGGTLSVSGITTLSSNLIVSGVKSTSLGGTLGVSGITTLTSNLNVLGSYPTTLGGTLGVSGITTFTNSVICNSNLNLNSSFNISGITTLSSNLNVSGITTLDNNLIISGTKTASIGGTLGVSGDSTLSGNVNVGGILYANRGNTAFAPPSTAFATISTGEKLALWKNYPAGYNLGFGIESGYMWHNVNVGDGYKWYVGGANNQKMIMNNAGDVGIGSTTTLSAKFNVRGDCYFSSNVSIGTTSGLTSVDYKLYVVGDAFINNTLKVHDIYTYILLPDQDVSAQYYGLSFCSANGTGTAGYHFHTNNLTITNMGLNTLFVIEGQNQSYGAFTGELTLLGQHYGSAGYSVNYKFNVLGVSQTYLAVYDNANTLKIDASLGNLNTDVYITPTTNMVSGTIPGVIFNASSTLRTVTIKVQLPSQPGVVGGLLKWSAGGKSTTFSVGNY